MEHLFRSYLELLQSILSNLSQLTKLVHRKIEVAQMDDLEALDEILNEEQALALAFRGLEQKRLNLLRELDLSEVPLAQLSAHFPPEMEEAVRQTAAELMEQYRTYHDGAQTARGILEHNPVSYTHLGLKKRIYRGAMAAHFFTWHTAVSYTHLIHAE